MMSRNRVFEILARHLAGSAPAQREAAADAILAEIGEWDDVTDRADLDRQFSTQCAEVTYLADQVQRGGEFRVLQRRAR